MQEHCIMIPIPQTDAKYNFDMLWRLAHMYYKTSYNITSTSALLFERNPESVSKHHLLLYHHQFQSHFTFLHGEPVARALRGPDPPPKLPKSRTLLSFEGSERSTGVRV